MKQNGPNPIQFYILYFFIQRFGSHIGINKTFESACVNKFTRWLLLLRRPVTWYTAMLLLVKNIFGGGFTHYVASI